MKKPYRLTYTKSFKKDQRKIIKQGKNQDRLVHVLKLLQAGKDIPFHYKDHALTGSWVGHRDIHITPDWLLIYRIDEENNAIILIRTGSHSDIFR